MATIRSQIHVEQTTGLGKQAKMEGIDQASVKSGVALMITGLKEKTQGLKNNFVRFKMIADTKSRQRATIDDCRVRDSLNGFYHHLSRAIKEADPEDETAVLEAGPFEGDLDEIWSLRERVVRRLATFDAYWTALDEVEKADVDV